jgi:hypothetical protein
MAQQPGRKSAAASLVKMPTKPKRPRLTPVLPLSTEEQSRFTALVQDNPHLVESDAQLLTQYVVAMSKAARLARDEDINDWDKAVRLALQVGTKLKILPSTTQDPVTIGRRKADHRASGGQVPWLDTLTEMNESAYGPHEGQDDSDD